MLGAALAELAVPDARSLAWLAVPAVSAQVCGWLLMTSSLPRLPAARTSVLLLAQPAGAPAVSAVVLGESPTGVQLGGAAAILAGVVLATATRPQWSSHPRKAR